jgi:hypothetical protein
MSTKLPIYKDYMWPIIITMSRMRMVRTFIAPIVDDTVWLARNDVGDP